MLPAAIKNREESKDGGVGAEEDPIARGRKEGKQKTKRRYSGEKWQKKVAMKSEPGQRECFVCAVQLGSPEKSCSPQRPILSRSPHLKVGDEKSSGRGLNAKQRWKKQDSHPKANLRSIVHSKALVELSFPSAMFVLYRCFSLFRSLFSRTIIPFLLNPLRFYRSDSFRSNSSSAFSF